MLEHECVVISIAYGQDCKCKARDMSLDYLPSMISRYTCIFRDGLKFTVQGSLNSMFNSCEMQC